MCSTPGELLAKIGAAIDELAADSAASAPPRSAEDMADRLAQLWAMIAELDPELARRLPGYGA